MLLPTLGDVFQNRRFELVSIGFVLALWSASRALNVFLDISAIIYGQSAFRGLVGTRVLSFSHRTARGRAGADRSMKKAASEASPVTP